GLLAYNDRSPGGTFESFYETFKPISVHCEGALEEDVFVNVYGTNTEGILGDIDTDECVIGHNNTSITDFLAMAGDTSIPILHIDEGSLTQPTYHGLGRQGTDSFEGLLTQDICSYPALPHDYYTGYTRSYKKCNINS
ncbi:MAG TPA: hypothetical protein PLW88_05625, partial [Syntrophorhabdaceae bacterium]|nr:hypothetical protein [Syntrophorhabdaceae bacterium]